jgi:hypothetical protein
MSAPPLLPEHKHLTPSSPVDASQATLGEAESKAKERRQHRLAGFPAAYERPARVLLTATAQNLTRLAKLLFRPSNPSSLRGLSVVLDRGRRISDRECLHNQVRDRIGL